METDFEKSSIKCIIASCNSPNDSPIRLFQFPSDQFTYDQWIESCDLERNMVKSTARVCERHFDADCLGKVGLKPGSVPTLNLSLLTPLNADIFGKNTNDQLLPLTWQTSSSRSTIKMNQSYLATDSPTSTSTSRTFSDHLVDKRPIENQIAGVDNNHKISKELEQESETEIENLKSNVKPLECGRSIAIKDHRVGGAKCIIGSCGRGYRNGSKESPVKLFSFPTDPVLFDKWIESCQLDRNMIRKTARVCARHFEPRCVGKIRLKHGTVPTLIHSILKPLDASTCGKNNNDDHLPPLILETSPSRSTVNMNQSCLVTDSPTSTSTSRTFSDHTVDNRPIENQIDDGDNNHKISKELEQESETEIENLKSNVKPLEIGKSIDFVFCKLATETETKKKLSATTVDNRPIENQIDDVDNNHKISKELEQESKTEMENLKSDVQPLKSGRSNGNKCIIRSCGSGYRNSSKEYPVKLFSFPRDPVLFDKWIETCQLDKNMIRKTSRVCARHFEPRCIGRIRLKPGTVPTLIHSILKPLDASTCGKNNNDDHLPPLILETSPSRSTVNMNQSCLVTDSRRSWVTSTKPFSEKKVDKPTENRMTSKGIKVADEDNNNERIISIDFEREAETETADDDPLQINKCDDNDLSENTIGKNGLETRMKITLVKLADLQYKKSNDLEKESETDTPDGNRLENNEKEICEDEKNIDAHGSRKDIRRAGLGKRKLKAKAIPTLNIEPSNSGTCDENLFSGNSATNKQTENSMNSKRVKLGHVDNIKEISNELEQDFDTDTSDVDPFECSDSSAIEICEAENKNEPSANHEHKPKSNGKCIISSCRLGNIESSTDFPVRLFSFPSYLFFFNKWVEACNLDRMIVKRTSLICERHFEAQWLGKNGLNNGAIPTLNLSDNSVLAPLNARTCDENSFLRNSLDNKSIENSLKSNNYKNIINNTIPAVTPDKDTLENTESIDIERCSNCAEKEHNETYYRKKCFELLAEKQKKEEQYNKQKIRYNNFRKVIARTKRQPVRKPSFLHLIANMSHVSPEAKAISTMLLKGSNKFTPTQKVIAQNIRFYSSRTYKYLRNVLHLNMPSGRCLDRWAMRFGSGFSPDLRDTHSFKKVP